MNGVQQHTANEQQFLINNVWKDRLGCAHLDSKPFSTTTEVAGKTGDDDGTINLIWLMFGFLVLNKYNEIRSR
jgi:hypothetical protein